MQGLPLHVGAEQMQAILVSCLTKEHTGRDRGIRADDLAKKLGICTRELRLHVSALRDEGVAIVATPATGYFIARTADELEECCAFLRNRALHSLRIEAKLRKVSLPELLGQMRITETER